jgi:hypothetical protein
MWRKKFENMLLFNRTFLFCSYDNEGSDEVEGDENGM